MRSRLCIRTSPQRLDQRCAGAACAFAPLCQMSHVRGRNRLAFKRLSILIYFPATQMTSCRSSHSATGGLSIGRCTASCPLLSLYAVSTLLRAAALIPGRLGRMNSAIVPHASRTSWAMTAAAGSVNAGSSVPRVSGRAVKRLPFHSPSASGRGRAAAAKGRSIHG